MTSLDQKTVWGTVGTPRRKYSRPLIVWLCACALLVGAVSLWPRSAPITVDAPASVSTTRAGVFTTRLTSTVSTTEIPATTATSDGTTTTTAASGTTTTLLSDVPPTTATTTKQTTTTTKQTTTTTTKPTTALAIAPATAAADMVQISTPSAFSALVGTRVRPLPGVWYYSYTRYNTLDITAVEFYEPKNSTGAPDELIQLRISVAVPCAGSIRVRLAVIGFALEQNGQTIEYTQNIEHQFVAPVERPTLTWNCPRSILSEGSVTAVLSVVFEKDPAVFDEELDGRTE